MSTTTAPSLDEYTWEVHPEAARWVSRTVAMLAKRNPTIDRLGRVLREKTGTRLIDWIDHLAVDAADAAVERELTEVGYIAESNGDGISWRHPLGMFPPVIVDAGRVGIGVRCDSLDDCLATLPAVLELPPVAGNTVIGRRGGPFRQATLSTLDGASLWIVERHGHQGFAEPDVDSAQIAAATRHLNAFRSRNRNSFSADGFKVAFQLFAAAADDLGRAWACDLFFQAEREYWQSRNHAARVQYERQNRLGLGWANHDHHTYRSSRAAFRYLIATLEQMGFLCRERFYAGREAGWGAQVLEQPECRIVIFADVDLSPEELVDDFAHQPLVGRDELGTVGLWCELHGEAFLEAGMHHLECQFDFDASRAQLAEQGIETMAPFTDFPFLRQAFTRGETWPVDPRRIERLVKDGRVTREQADRFRREGALGSHLEILERNDGYKGFNQTGVSEIITRTDPRRMIGA
ncbi:MAG: hypothetical protein L0228_01025 [Planctomycetes bacterium]|nr:hypothetical protein [Planctomycetota bacterium]